MDYRPRRATREWGEKAIDAGASAWARRRCSSAPTRNVGTGEMSARTAREVARSCCASLDARARRAGWRAMRPSPTATSCRRSRRARLRRPRSTHLEAGRAFCDEHDLLAWDTYLGGWEAHIALDQRPLGRGGGASPRNLERTRGPLPHSRFRSLLVLGLLHARRGDADPWPALDEALAIAVEADELRHARRRSPPRARRRAGSPASRLVADEIDDTLGARRGQRSSAGRSASWRSGATAPACRSPMASGCPPPYRAELTRDARAAAGVLDRARLPLRRGAGARAGSGRRPAREPARASEPGARPRRGDRRPSPA